MWFLWSFQATPTARSNICEVVDFMLPAIDVIVVTRPHTQHSTCPLGYNGRHKAMGLRIYFVVSGLGEYVEGWVCAYDNLNYNWKLETIVASK